MDFLIECVHGKLDIQEALENVKNGDRLGFDFKLSEWENLQVELDALANYSFLAEQLESKGIECIHVFDKYVYPKSLKENLKKEAPLVIYAKGNLDIIKCSSVAIVGARKSGKTALDFTDRIARSAARGNRIIVSGFAKGVDKQALDSALKYKGKSIIVLPQGIDTYASKTYYPAIAKGDVLVISTYHPKVPWSVGLAMDRNKTIYALAEDIYAAESNDSGGTWEGVLNGLKRGRRVFVRQPRKGEKNANDKLIDLGATPVDEDGSIVSEFVSQVVEEKRLEYRGSIKQLSYVDQVIEMLRELNGKGLSTKEMALRLSLDQKGQKQLTAKLKKSDALVIKKKGRENIYYLKDLIATQQSLF